MALYDTFPGPTTHEPIDIPNYEQMKKLQDKKRMSRCFQNLDLSIGS